jgi:hypothetical protein
MTLLQSRDLLHITQSREQAFRPSAARVVLPVDNSVPDWAMQVEHSEITFSGEDPVLLSHGAQKNLPTNTIDKTTSTINVYRFGMALNYDRFEIRQAAQAKVNLSAMQVRQNALKAERFIERIAAGDLQSTYGLPGLLTNATLISAVGTASTKTGGGTTWAAATFEEIVDEVAVEIQGIRAATYGVKEANMLVLPEVCYEVVERRMHPFSSITVLDHLKRVHPGVEFVPWHKCNLANVGGTGGRLVTMAAGESTARLIIPTELTEDQPLPVPFGEQVPQYFSTAGVLIEDTTAIRYLDGVS